MHVELSEFQVQTVLFLWVRSTGAITDAEFATWLEHYGQIHVAAKARGHQLAILYDLTRASPLSAQQRRMQADWMRRFESVGREVTLGVAFVTTSAIIRGVLTAIFWVRPPYAPHDVCARLNDGLEWLFERCEQRSVLVDRAMRVELRRRFKVADASP